MTFASVLFWGWLTVGWLPQGGLAIYDNPIPEVIEFAGSYFTELGGEATWGPLFAGGAVRTTMWAEVGKLGFWPNEMEFTFDTGLKWGGVRLGYQHTCYHPVVPDLGVIEWIGRKVLPRWDGSYDCIYLRVEGGRR